jgi:glycosyltransferase involved in cell wall biosynthesis
MEKATIILPFYNAEKYLSKCINSILNQTFTDYYIYAIDDCSTDNSLQILESITDSRIKIFRNSENIGSLKSRNILLKKVITEYVVFQDADDVSDPNRLATLINFMDSNQDIMLCGSNANYFDEKYRHICTSAKPLNMEIIKEKFAIEIPIIFATSIVRSSVFNEIGYFREYFHDKGNYDYDWMIRISEKYKCANLEFVLYSICRQRHSNSNTYKNLTKPIGHKIVQFLANQRRETETDSLLNDDLATIEAYIENETRLYKEDPSLICIDNIHGYLSENQNMLAIKESFLSIKRNPTKFYNYRTLFYVIKQTLKKI